MHVSARSTTPIFHTAHTDSDDKVKVVQPAHADRPFTVSETPQDQLLADLSARNLLDTACNLIISDKQLPNVNRIHIENLLRRLFGELRVRIAGIINEKGQATEHIVSFSPVELFRYLIERGRTQENTDLCIKDIEIAGAGALSVLPGAADMLVQALLDDPDYKLHPDLAKDFEGDPEQVYYLVHLPLTSPARFNDCKNLFLQFLAEKACQAFPGTPIKLMCNLVEATSMFACDIPEVFYQPCLATFPLIVQTAKGPKTINFVISQLAGDSSPFCNEALSVPLKNLIEPAPGQPMPILACRTSASIWQNCLDRLTGCLRIKTPIPPTCKLYGCFELMHAYAQGLRPIQPGTEKALLDASFDAILGNYVLSKTALEKVARYTGCPHISLWDIAAADRLEKLAAGRFDMAIALLVQTSIALHRHGYAQHIAPLWEVMRIHLQQIRPKRLEDGHEDLWSLIHRLMDASPEQFDMLLAMLEIKTFLSLCTSSGKGEPTRILPSGLGASLTVSEGAPALKLADGSLNLYLPFCPASAWKRLYTELDMSVPNQTIKEIGSLLDTHAFPEGNDASIIGRHHEILNIDFNAIAAGISDLVTNDPFYKKLSADGILACHAFDQQAAPWRWLKASLTETLKTLPDEDKKQAFILHVLSPFIQTPQDAPPAELLWAKTLLDNLDPIQLDGDIYQSYQLWLAYHEKNIQRTCADIEWEITEKIAAYRPDLAAAMLEKLKGAHLLDMRRQFNKIGTCITRICRQAKNKPASLSASQLALMQELGQGLVGKELKTTTADMTSQPPGYHSAKLIAALTGFCHDFPEATSGLVYSIAQLHLTRGDIDPADKILKAHQALCMPSSTALKQLCDFLARQARNASTPQTKCFALQKLCQQISACVDAQQKSICSKAIMLSLEHVSQFLDTAFIAMEDVLQPMTEVLQQVCVASPDKEISQEHLQTLLHFRLALQTMQPQASTAVLWSSFDDKLLNAFLACSDKPVQNAALALDACACALASGKNELAAKVVLRAIKMELKDNQKSRLISQLASILDCSNEQPDVGALFNTLDTLMASTSVEKLLKEYPSETFRMLMPLLRLAGAQQDHLPPATAPLLRLALQLCTLETSEEDYLTCALIAVRFIENGLSRKSALFKEIRRHKDALLKALPQNSNDHGKLNAAFFQAPLPSAEPARQSQLQDPDVILAEALNQPKPDLEAILDVVLGDLNDQHNITAGLELFSQHLKRNTPNSPPPQTINTINAFTTAVFNIVTRPRTEKKRIAAAIHIWKIVRQQLVSQVTAGCDLPGNVKISVLSKKTHNTISVASLKFLKQFMDSIELLFDGFIASDTEFPAILEQVAKIMATGEEALISTITDQEYYNVCKILPDARFRMYHQTIHDSLIERIKSEAETGSPHGVRIPYKYFKAMAAREPLHRIKEVCLELIHLNTYWSVTCALYIVQGVLSLGLPAASKKDCLPWVEQLLNQAAATYPLRTKELVKHCLSYSRDILPLDSRKVIWETLLENLILSLDEYEVYSAEGLQSTRALLSFFLDHPPSFKGCLATFEKEVTFVNRLLADLCIFENDFKWEEVSAYMTLLASRSPPRQCQSILIDQRIRLDLLERICLALIDTPQQLAQLLKATCEMIKLLPQELSPLYQHQLINLLMLFSARGFFDHNFARDHDATYKKYSEDMAALAKVMIEKAFDKLIPQYYSLLFALPETIAKRLCTKVTSEEISDYLRLTKKCYEQSYPPEFLCGFVHFKRLSALVYKSFDTHLRNNFQTYIDIMKQLMEIALKYADDAEKFTKMSKTIAPLLCLGNNLSTEAKEARSHLIIEWCQRLKSHSSAIVSAAGNDTLDFATKMGATISKSLETKQ